MRCLAIFIVFLLSVAVPCQAGGTAKAKTAPARVTGELLVQFAPGVRKSGVVSLKTRLGAQLKNRFPHLQVEHWKLAEGADLDAALVALNDSGQVLFAEPNYRRYPRAIPNDPRFNEQWGLHNLGQLINGVPGVNGADMDLARAWDITTGDRQVVVAVMDDAIDIQHPDLAANIWTNPGEIAGNGMDDDGNGFVDDVHGWDFAAGDNNPGADDALEGHGTGVSGAVGAVGNNGSGISGAAWNVQIMPLKFGFDVASELAAMEYAVNNGADIVNASWGGSTLSLAESGGVAVLEAAGILLVVAAGNNAVDHALVPDYPSGLPNVNVLAVAASDVDDQLAPFSDFGPLIVDVAAPGRRILTTMDPLSSAEFGGSGLSGLFYDYTAGTSFSSPSVAGVAALVKSAYPAADAVELKARLMAGVEPIDSSRPVLATGGRVNALNALTVLPQPVLVVQSVQVSDGGNGFLDPGETADLLITLENVWIDATGVSAVLRSTDADIVIGTASATYGSIASTTARLPGIPFSVQLAAGVSGHRRIPFQLDISADGMNPVQRSFFVEIGTLGDGVSINASLDQHPQDKIHRYHIDVPAGSASLQVSTLMADGIDIDLLVRRGALPEFDLTCYFSTPSCLDADSVVSAASIGSSEFVQIDNPLPGTYQVLVISWAPQRLIRPTPYVISSNLTGALPQPPLVRDDIISTPVGVAFTTSSLLANDLDSGGAMLTITSVTLVSDQGAFVILNLDGSVTYTPPVGFSGRDRFQYEVSNGTSTAVGTVLVDVRASSSSGGGCSVSAEPGGVLLPLLILLSLAYGWRRRRGEASLSRPQDLNSPGR